MSKTTKLLKRLNRKIDMLIDINEIEAVINQRKILGRCDADTRTTLADAIGKHRETRGVKPDDRVQQPETAASWW